MTLADPSDSTRSSSKSFSFFAFFRMSFAKILGLSLIPAFFWSFVPAAGIKPALRAVEPDGTESASIISTSWPSSYAESAAIMPQAPAPIINVSICIS